MIQRIIFDEAKYLLTQFRALCITGPRQSGKTTLSKLLFKGKPYITFENPEVQAEAEANPTAFLYKYRKGAIFDEIQRIPILFRYLQEVLDNNKQRGQFILTGSNNFLLQEQVSQTLAGRAGYLSLLPLSYAEIKQANIASASIYQHILKGGYPEIWDQKLNPHKWMESYTQTYVQRDVRLLRNITNLAAFTRFIALCANYAGQIVNRDELAKQVGVDTKTIQAWLGILESSYIIFLLQPWHNNLNKRIIKSPKLYFYDTGLLCFLQRIKTQADLLQHHLYGAIFENWVITEIKKNKYNIGESAGMHYFRDSAGNEVDIILQKGDATIAIEVKAAKKLDTALLGGLKYWQKYQPNTQTILVYGGTASQELSATSHLLPWQEVVFI